VWVQFVQNVRPPSARHQDAESQNIDVGPGVVQFSPEETKALPDVVGRHANKFVEFIFLLVSPSRLFRNTILSLSLLSITAGDQQNRCLPPSTRTKGGGNGWRYLPRATIPHQHPSISRKTKDQRRKATRKKRMLLNKSNRVIPLLPEVSFLSPSSSNSGAGGGGFSSPPQASTQPQPRVLRCTPCLAWLE